ncbi:MAG: 16S rRNA (guanine(966)-N(2))-methyltransferase RsmD [Phycisphaerae bacterium]|nr:16S rRNA (guanine(966)-N(2))-methyltransferase RsmD [Gemmatimonadaceae bacterium]
MRIIAGKWRGRKIAAPPGHVVRPTGDRVRESWMSILHPELPDARVVDLCAGSGALGLEALSRGAATCDFVETARPVLTVLQSNIELLNAGGSATIHRNNAEHFVSALPAGAYDVAFADPPYNAETALKLAQSWLDVPFAHVLCIEHSASVHLPGGADRRRYGISAITFFR